MPCFWFLLHGAALCPDLSERSRRICPLRPIFSRAHGRQEWARCNWQKQARHDNYYQSPSDYHVVGTCELQVYLCSTHALVMQVGLMRCGACCANRSIEHALAFRRTYHQSPPASAALQMERLHMRTRFAGGLRQGHHQSKAAIDTATQLKLAVAMLAAGHTSRKLTGDRQVFSHWDSLGCDMPRL